MARARDKELKELRIRNENLSRRNKEG